MKKLFCVILLLSFALAGCTAPPGTVLDQHFYRYEVHLDNGDTFTVCADDVKGVLDSGLIFTLHGQPVGAVSGEHIYFTSVQVESCDK